MARKYFSFRSFHRGTVLFEALLVSVILSLAALAVIPLYTGWRSEKRLELAAEEVASAIRQVEILAKNESADYPSMSEGLTFFCETMTDGTGRYYTRKGTERESERISAQRDPRGRREGLAPFPERRFRRNGRRI